MTYPPIDDKTKKIFDDWWEKFRTPNVPKTLHFLFRNKITNIATENPSAKPPSFNDILDEYIDVYEKIHIYIIILLKEGKIKEIMDLLKSLPRDAELVVVEQLVNEILDETKYSTGRDTLGDPNKTIKLLKRLEYNYIDDRISELIKRFE